MLDYQSQPAYKRGISHLHDASRNLDTLVGAMQEELSDTGLARLQLMLVALIEKTPRMDDEYEAFFLDLQGITGIFVLVTANSKSHSPLWWKFHEIAFSLLSACSGFKELRAAAR